MPMPQALLLLPSFILALQIPQSILKVFEFRSNTRNDSRKRSWNGETPSPSPMTTGVIRYAVVDCLGDKARTGP